MNNWTEKYLYVRNTFCERCDCRCNEKRKIFCIEQFLYIVEMWEISNDSDNGSEQD
jgi:hypothetical protein